jgi:hypothetical protein
MHTLPKCIQSTAFEHTIDEFQEGHYLSKSNSLRPRGAFHLTEIPEDDNLSRLSTNWKFRKFRNFYIPLKHFPTRFLSKNRHQNQNSVFSTISVPRVWIYFAECWKKRFERQCQTLVEIKETSFQNLTCSIWFASKISGISVKWKAPNKPPIIYKACHAVAFHFATGHSEPQTGYFVQMESVPILQVPPPCRKCLSMRYLKFLADPSRILWHRKLLSCPSPQTIKSRLRNCEHTQAITACGGGRYLRELKPIWKIVLVSFVCLLLS